MTIGLLAGSSLTSCGPVRSPADSRLDRHDRVLIDDVARIDASIPGVPTETLARQAFAAYSEKLQRCDASVGDRTQWATCGLDAILGPDGIRPTSRASSPEVHTATFALSSGEGSCAAIVAAVLALTERGGAPLEAVVLRDHVVLAARWDHGLFFEPLERGRAITVTDLSRHGSPPPGGPVRVRGHEYLPYYLDNLAARLAEAGDGAGAEQAFRRAIELGPKIGRIRFNFGTFLTQRGRYREAEPFLDSAIRLGWDDASAWVNYGVTLWKLGNTRAARNCFETALRLQPDNRDAANNLQELAERPHTGRPR